MEWIIFLAIGIIIFLIANTLELKYRITKISIIFITGAIIINFINYIFFYNEINPFYEPAAFWAFLAGLLGISIPLIIFAGIFSVFYVYIKKYKEKFLHYFFLLFLVFSLFSLYMSYATM